MHTAISAERCDFLAQHPPGGRAMNCDKVYEITKDVQFALCGVEAPSTERVFSGCGAESSEVITGHILGRFILQGL